VIEPKHSRHQCANPIGVALAQSLRALDGQPAAVFVQPKLHDALPESKRSPVAEGRIEYRGGRQVGAPVRMHRAGKRNRFAAGAP
jgi:hypothetical protein